MRDCTFYISVALLASGPLIGGVTMYLTQPTQITFGDCSIL